MILLAQWLFRRWLTPPWCCALWLLVAARLLLPVSVPTRFSVFNFVPTAVRQGPSGLSRSAAISGAEVTTQFEMRAVTPSQLSPANSSRIQSITPLPLTLAKSSPANALDVQNSARRISWPIVMFGVWFAGALALACQ